MDLPKDLEELGRRHRAARGYAGLSRPELAAALGVHESTIRRRESGDAGALGGKPAKRASVVESVMEVTQAPSVIFELAASEVGSDVSQRLEAFEQRLSHLEHQDLDEQEADEEAVAQQYETTAGHSSMPGRVKASS